MTPHKGDPQCRCKQICPSCISSLFLHHTRYTFIGQEPYFPHPNCICDHERHLPDTVTIIDAVAFKIVASNGFSLVQAVENLPLLFADNPALRFGELPVSVAQSAAVTLLSYPFRSLPAFARASSSPAPDDCPSSSCRYREPCHQRQILPRPCPPVYEKFSIIFIAFSPIK